MWRLHPTPSLTRPPCRALSSCSCSPLPPPELPSHRLPSLLLPPPCSWQDVVNCIQCHPHLPVLATSGIEDVVRLWAPGGEDPQVGGGAASDVDSGMPGTYIEGGG